MEHSSKIIIEEISTPAGDMVLGAKEQYLCLCDWKVNRHRDRNDNRIQRLLGVEYERIAPIYEYECIAPIYNKVESDAFFTIRKAKQELGEYFAGKRMAFDIPLLMVGTEFQKTIWHTLQSISYGSTVGYMDIANQVGNPKGVRAVAQAIGANPLSIFVPCHRVVGSNGALTGYAGGMEAKRFLLQLERYIKIRYGNEKCTERARKGQEKGKKKARKGHEEILSLLKENPYISVASIAKECSISAKTARNIIDELREGKFLVRVGPDNGGYWKVLAEEMDMDVV